MLKPLISVPILLSGNIKIQNFVNVSRLPSGTPGRDTIYVGSVRAARLIPATSSDRYSNISCNLLTSDYSHDITKFYSAFYDIFYEDGLDADTLGLHEVIGEVAKSNYVQDLQWGCERISTGKNRGCTHMFYAPLWTTGEVPDEFVIEFEIPCKGSTTVKQLRINLVQATETHDLPRYLSRYCEKLDDTVIRLDHDSDCAYVYGLDVVRGTIKSAYDITARALWNYYMPVNDFDYTIASLFRNTKCVAKQILPLAFAFDLSDILTRNEQYCSDITVRGYYVHKEQNEEEGRYASMYAFDTEYENYHVNFYDIPEYTLNCTDSGQQLKSLQPQIFTTKNSKYEVSSTKCTSTYPHGIFRAGPFDCEIFKLYEGDLDKYRGCVQEIQPYYCKWKLTGTPDNIPYIININEEYNTVAKRYKYAITEEKESKYYMFHTFGRYYNTPTNVENKTWLYYNYDTDEVSYVDDPTLLASRDGCSKLLNHYKNFSAFFADTPLYRLRGESEDNLQFDDAGNLKRLVIGPVVEGNSTGQVMVNGILYNISGTGAKNLRVERDIIPVNYLDGAYCGILKKTYEGATLSVNISADDYVNIYSGSVTEYSSAETLNVSQNAFAIPYNGNEEVLAKYNSINYPEVLCLAAREPRYVIYNISEDTALQYPNNYVKQEPTLTLTYDTVMSGSVEDIESNFRSHEAAQTYRVGVRGVCGGIINLAAYKKDFNPAVTVDSTQETARCTHEVSANKINLYDIVPDGEQYEQFLKRTGGNFRIPYKKIRFSTPVHTAVIQENRLTVTKWYRYPPEYVNSIILYFALQLFSDRAENVKKRVNAYASRFGYDVDTNTYFKAVLYDTVKYTYKDGEGNVQEVDTITDDKKAGAVYQVQYGCADTPTYTSFTMWDLVWDVYTCWSNKNSDCEGTWTLRVNKKPAFYWGFGYESANEVLRDAVTTSNYRNVSCGDLELGATYNPVMNMYEYGAPVSMMYISSEEIVRFYTYVAAKYKATQKENIATALKTSTKQWQYDIASSINEKYIMTFPVDSFGTVLNVTLDVECDEPFGYRKTSDGIMVGVIDGKLTLTRARHNFTRHPDIETPQLLFSLSGNSKMAKYRGYPVGLDAYLNKLEMWRKYAYDVLDSWDIKTTISENARRNSLYAVQEVKEYIARIYELSVSEAHSVHNGYLNALYNNPSLFPTSEGGSDTVNYTPDFHRTRRFVPVNDIYDLLKVAQKRSGYLYVHAPLLRGSIYDSSYTDDIVFQFKLRRAGREEYYIQYSEADTVVSGAGTSTVRYSRKNTVVEQRLDIDYLKKNKKLYLGEGPLYDVIFSYLDSTGSFELSKTAPLYNTVSSYDFQLFFIDELIPVTDTGIFTMLCMYERGDARFWKVGAFANDTCAVMPPLEETDDGKTVMLQHRLLPQYDNRDVFKVDSESVMSMLQRNLTDKYTDYDESVTAAVEGDIHTNAVKTNVLPHNTGIFVAPRNAFMEEESVRTYSDLPFSENFKTKSSMVLRQIENCDYGDWENKDLYWILKAPSVRWGLYTQGDNALLRFNIFITKDNTSINLIDNNIQYQSLNDVIQREIDRNPYSFISALKINMLPHIYSTPWAIKPRSLHMKNDIQTVDGSDGLTLIKTSQQQTYMFQRYFGFITPLIREVTSEVHPRYRIRQESVQFRSTKPVRTSSYTGVYNPDRYEHYLKISSRTELIRQLYEYKWYNASKVISCPKEFSVKYGVVPESQLCEAEGRARELFEKYLGRLRYSNPEMRAYLFFNYKVNYIKEHVITGQTGEKNYALTFKYTLQ